MKRIKRLMLIAILAAAAICYYRYNLDHNKDLARDWPQSNEAVSEQEKAKSKIADAAIVRKAMKSVGVLSVLEGEENFNQLIEEENWYSYRGMHINWYYRFSIAIHLENMEVEIIGDTLRIQWDRQKLFLLFIEKTKDSDSYSQASLFAKKYSSQEITALEKAVMAKVEENIKKNTLYWEQAENSLKVQLKKMCNDLGYAHVEIVP